MKIRPLKGRQETMKTGRELGGRTYNEMPVLKKSASEYHFPKYRITS